MYWGKQVCNLTLMCVLQQGYKEAHLQDVIYDMDVLAGQEIIRRDKVWKQGRDKLVT